MSEELVQETNQLRSSLGPRELFTDGGFLRGLANDLKNNKTLARQPIIQCFIEDISHFGDSPRLLNTKTHIKERRDHQIFSLFDASMFPSLSLDCFTYKPLHVVDETFASKYKSQTNPVTLEHASEGFAARIVVALFPENHIDKIQGEDDAIFYFIDKFVERHRRITQKLLANVVAGPAFSLLHDASQQELEKVSSHWVWLHEYFHRRGDMPLPRYLKPKSILKPLAGLEELRVDVLALVECRTNNGLKERDAELTYQFILAERLLRYAVEGIPNPNYDAIASQLLFNYLIKNNGIFTADTKISLTKELPDVLVAFLSQIAAMEALVHHETPEYVESKLLEFVNQYTNYDSKIDDYAHIDFFLEVKQRLNV